MRIDRATAFAFRGEIPPFPPFPLRLALRKGEKGGKEKRRGGKQSKSGL